MIPRPDEGAGEATGPPRIRPYLHTPPAPRQPEQDASADAAAPAAGHDPAATLRPFVLTSGRVTADPNIGLETQVTAHPGAAVPRLPPESRAIVALCAQPLSVAEISARLRLHLGVTKILVDDLRAAGHLDVHVLDEKSPDPDTILRVIRGLRAIS